MTKITGRAALAIAALALGGFDVGQVDVPGVRVSR
jgi:hypothetical protein